MSVRSNGSRNGSSSLSVQQLREKIGLLFTSTGQQTQQQKHEFLNQYIAKWSMNQQRMTQQQFVGALQSLHLPLSGAPEVFAALDADNSGTVEIREFCEAMVNDTPLPAPGSKRATRNAGSDIVMSARRPSATPSATGDRYERTTSTMNAPAAERGYTPVKVTAAQKVGNSRNGSRTGSANRSPMVGTPLSQSMASTVKPPLAPTATSSRPRANRAALAEVDFSDIVISKFRSIILHRGGSSGIHSLARIFRIMDDDSNRRISLEELQYGLQDFGLSMGMKDLQLLLAAIDKDNTGALSFDEFLVAIRGVVNARRQTLINMAFDVLDATGDGWIQVDDLAAHFDAKGHPDVVAGRLQEEHALANFLSQFDGADQNGVVTRREFLEYYRNVSASVDDDDYFELMIRNAWHITGGTGQYQNTANTRLLVTLVDGSEKVVTLEHDLGLDMRNVAVVKAQLKAQGISNAVSFSMAGR